MAELPLNEKIKIIEELLKEDYGTYGTVKIGEIRGQLILRIPQRIRRQLNLKKGDMIEIEVNPKEKKIILKVV
ncbi:MAG: AbrB/MazE/SpoVT family DNA-binding domain-containing protein [Candidatus Micrarchaeaceae archaeon]